MKISQATVGVIKSWEKDICSLKKIQKRDKTIQDKVWTYKDGWH